MYCVQIYIHWATYIHWAKLNLDFMFFILYLSKGFSPETESLVKNNTINEWQLKRLKSIPSESAVVSTWMYGPIVLDRTWLSGLRSLIYLHFNTSLLEQDLRFWFQFYFLFVSTIMVVISKFKYTFDRGMCTRKFCGLKYYKI